MRLLGYVRASDAKSNAGVQIDSVMSAGVEPHDIFCDVTSVAKDAPDPPAMRRLLEYAEEGDAIVLWRIDRLGQSLTDVLSTVSNLADRGITIHSVQDGIDPSTIHGRLMVDLLASLAEYERHLTGERIAAGMASARREGRKLGRPSVDKAVTADKLRTVQESRARGLTAADAAQLVGWSRATFYRHLHEHEAQR